jgi:hypothetical protein
MLRENREPDLGKRFGDTQAQVARAREQLEALREPLTSDMSIEALEQFEKLWKRALADLMIAPLTGADARYVAAFQRDIGLLPKYKSYAIKASSPLGYSVFFQEPGKGFSFQQHRHHKVEIFHVLDARPDSFAFICTLEEWTAVYERDEFARWLEGSSNRLYDRWRIPLVPGDVICLESTGLVHSVIGCVLEEFATVSTDMVDRLYDQNEGAPIPESYCRTVALNLLRSTPSPPTSQGILLSSQMRLPLPLQRFKGGEIVTLGKVPGLRASRIRLESNRQSPLQRSEEEAIVLFASRGDTSLLLGTAEELSHEDLPALELPKGAAVLIPPAMSYQIAALGTEAEVSLHSIRPDIALTS